MTTPTKGKKIALRGLSPEQETEARACLALHGFEVTASLACADTLVVGSGDSSQAIELARKSKLPVTPYGEFVASIECSGPTALPGELPRRTAVEVKADSVRILDQELPRANSTSPLVPPAEAFFHLCLDAGFMQTARAVAMGVRNRFPVMLEGETCASKTISIRWLARLLGQPAIRLNLNGQSDASELVGRYVPGAATRENEAGLLAEVGDRRNGKGSARTPANLMTSAGRWSKWEPGITSQTEASWHFREGCVPEAMRRGHWVICDELNLAEPQVVERLNPALEQPATLVLSEGDGTTFGPGGTVPVARGFHLLATMNPAEYAGRSVLSPAFRDRWSVWHQAEAPGEVEYTAMLHCLVFGEQPEFAFRGVRYYSPATKPVHPELGAIEGIREMLRRLALFHCSLCRAAGMGGTAPSLGRGRRERYVFTRRTLLICLELLARARKENREVPAEAQLRQAIEDAYLARMRDRADRKAAETLLRAEGLGDL